jgi:uncharacterized cupin superfamily protein
MTNTRFDQPVPAERVPSSSATAYPEPFASMMRGRHKAKLGDAFGLSNFGVNLTRLEPGAISALFHAHSEQDEFVYVLEGRPTLCHGEHEHVMSPGECMGFPAGTGIGHQLVNRTDAPVVYLEVGDRTTGDRGQYPRDDFAAVMTGEGKWAFTHKDGTPY